MSSGRIARNPVRRLQARLAGMAAVIGQTRDGVHGLSASQDAQRADIARLAERLEGIEELLRAEGAQAAGRDQHVRRILRVLHNDDRQLRQRLWHERSSAEYELAYSDPEPLVSVVIPTYDNFRLLGERSLPSVLAQTYQNFEVVVVGDEAPPEAAEVVAAFGDDRLRFHNLNRRGPYPADPYSRWLVAGIPAYNEAVHRSRGRWIAPLGDDDAFRPNHIEALLELARRERREATYGRFMMHFADDRPTETLGVFPPDQGQIGVQMLLYHARLSFFEMELADELFSMPGDWSLTERMLRSGVRFGMVDEVVTDYYPSASWTPRTST